MRFSLQESFKPNLAGASEHSLGKHQPQSRQDSGQNKCYHDHFVTNFQLLLPLFYKILLTLLFPGLGGSNEEQIATQQVLAARNDCPVSSQLCSLKFLFKRVTTTDSLREDLLVSKSIVFLLRYFHFLNVSDAVILLVQVVLLVDLCH